MSMLFSVRGITIHVFLTVLFLFSGAQIVSAAADPIAHWRFDEGSGTKAYSVAPATITGTFLTPNPTWSTDVPSVSFSNPYSLKFESTGDGISFPWPSSLDFGSTANRSFSFWYKPTANGETASGNYDRIMSWTGDGFEIAGTYGDVSVHRLAFYDGSWRDTNYDLSVGTWYNITFTYDGTNVKLYVSGVEKFSGTSAGRALNGTMYIGIRHTGDEGINGLIDDLRVYDYALTSGQVDNIVAGSDDPDSTPDTSSASTGGHAQQNRAFRLRMQKWAAGEYGDEELHSNTEAPTLQDVGIFSIADTISPKPSAPIVSSDGIVKPTDSLPRKLAWAIAESARIAKKQYEEVPTEQQQSDAFVERLCTRVNARFSGDSLTRVQTRIQNRFGFLCKAE